MAAAELVWLLWCWCGCCGVGVAAVVLMWLLQCWCGSCGVGVAAVVLVWLLLCWCGCCSTGATPSRSTLEPSDHQFREYCKSSSISWLSIAVGFAVTVGTVVAVYVLA